MSCSSSEEYTSTCGSIGVWPAAICSNFSSTRPSTRGTEQRRGTEAVAVVFEPLRQRQFLVARQERDRAHLAEVKAQRVVGAAGILILAGRIWWHAGIGRSTGRSLLNRRVIFIGRIEVVRVVVAIEIRLIGDLIPFPGGTASSGRFSRSGRCERL